MQVGKGDGLPEVDGSDAIGEQECSGRGVWDSGDGIGEGLSALIATATRSVFDAS